MQTTHSPGNARTSLPPISGALSYYPAIHRGTFPNTRAALASFGCIGAVADLHLANAKAEGSPIVAVPVNVTGAPPEAGECICLVQRKPGGRADLFLGLAFLADEDRSEAEARAQALTKACGGKVFVLEWTRQTGALQ